MNKLMTVIKLEANHCWEPTSKAKLANAIGEFGIYVLGIKNANNRIIPYYVGQTSEKLSEYLTKKRIPIIRSPNTTWAIFSQNFLKIKRATSSDFIKRVAIPGIQYKHQSLNFGNDILYLNEEYFFSHKNVVGSPVPSLVYGEKCRPISLLGKYPSSINLHKLATTTQSIIFDKQNLFFTTFTFKIEKEHLEKHNIQLETLLECVETYVKFSLKVNTVGKSQTLKTMKTKLKGINLFIDFTTMCVILNSEFYPSPR